MQHLKQWNTLSEARALIPGWILGEALRYMREDTILPWCGHFCLMMVTGMSFENACSLTRQIGGLMAEDIEAALKATGHPCRKYISNPRDSSTDVVYDVCRNGSCLSIAHVRDRSQSEWSHWIVIEDGIVYDPGMDRVGWFYPANYWIQAFIVIDKVR